jgi:hypothetical protein
MKTKKKQISETLFLTLACLSASSAYAQSYLSPGYILGEIRDGLGVVQQQPAPDFVVRGRPDPASLEYTPLKPPPRDFHSEANTPAKRIEAEAGTIAELESARARTQARAAGGASPKAAAKGAAPIEEDPVPMKWNAWDTE